MSQPRYAPSVIRFSAREALFGITVLAIAVLLCLPTVSRAATRQPGHPAAHSVAAADVVLPATSQPDLTIGDLQIHPLAISTSQPGAAAVDQGGLEGPAGDMSQLGIPTMVLHAYQLAAAELATEQPGCHLPWWILAGIGHTESGHAEGGRLTADGTTRGRILGPVLDGTLADNAAIPDTDHGVYDGDPVWDRAVGPMQFIPSTWKIWGADGNHDGKKDPNNIFDATLAAGRYLCADNRNLATLPGLQAAVLSYNHSQAYLDTVLAWGLAYRDGASAVADLVGPVVADVTQVRPPLGEKPPKPPVKITPGPTGSPSGSASGSGSPSGSGTGSGSGTPSGSASGSSSESATPSCSATPSASDSNSTGAANTAGDASTAGTAGTASTAKTASSAGTASTDGSTGADGSSSATDSPSASCTP